MEIKNKNNWICVGKNLGRSQNVEEWFNEGSGEFIDIIKWGNDGWNVIMRKGKDELDEDEILREEFFESYDDACRFADSLKFLNNLTRRRK
jgi:hypothetical protein